MVMKTRYMFFLIEVAYSRHLNPRQQPQIFMYKFKQKWKIDRCKPAWENRQICFIYSQNTSEYTKSHVKFQ